MGVMGKGRRPTFVVPLNKKNRIGLELLRKGFAEVGMPSHDAAIFDQMLMITLETLAELGKKEAERVEKARAIESGKEDVEGTEEGGSEV